MSVLKTGKSKQQEAVVELAQEAMLWADTCCEELAFAGYHYPSMGSVTVEAQKVYRGKTKNPQDIVVLAAAAGVVLHAACNRWPGASSYFPLPQDWKGGTPKRIHQARILKRLGVPCTSKGTKNTGYCVPHWPEGKEPMGADKLNMSDWKHVVDAIGIAMWGQEASRVKDLRTLGTRSPL